jgi:glycosyltransferase involved in cell wall biosynthesis
MRVLAVTNMYPTLQRPTYGGFVQSQVESLRREGVGIDVMFVDGVTSRVNYLRGVQEIRKRARVHRYDLVHAHYGLTGLVTRAQTRLPLVVSFCGDDILGTVSARGQGRTLGSLAIVAACQALAETCDAIIVKSEHMRRQLWSRRSRKRANVIPNGVDLAWARPMAREEAFARLPTLDPAKRYILFPNAPHVPSKRLSLAKAAMAELAAHPSEVELLVVHGQPRDLMPAYYAVADAMLLTSDSEGSPNVVKEALACEVPVVAVDVGDVRERIEGAPSCAVVERRPSALAGAVERAMACPRPGRLRERVTHLSAEAVARRIVMLYHEVLAARCPA